MAIILLGPGKRPPNSKIEVINTTSRATGWQKELSPFFAGPVTVQSDILRISKTVENAWQYSKVYAEHLGADGSPNSAYFKWAKAGFESSFSKRYPFGKGARPVCSFWNNQKLSYITARLTIYIPLYAEAISATSAFQKLAHQYENSEHLGLFDFDAYDHDALGMSLAESLTNSKRVLGHSFVLKALLTHREHFRDWLAEIVSDYESSVLLSATALSTKRPKRLKL